jgi:hypothetical protein
VRAGRGPASSVRHHGGPRGAPIDVTEEDCVVRRPHGLSTIQGTDVDALSRNLGCHTLFVTGVSADVAISDVVNRRMHRRRPKRRRRGVLSDCTPR